MQQGRTQPPSSTYAYDDSTGEVFDKLHILVFSPPNGIDWDLEMFFIISVENPAAAEHGECMSFPISSPPEGTWGRTTPALSHLPHIWICSRAQHQAMPSGIEEALNSGMEVQWFCWENIYLTGESSQYRFWFVIFWLWRWLNYMWEKGTSYWFQVFPPTFILCPIPCCNITLVSTFVSNKELYPK